MPAQVLIIEDNPANMKLAVMLLQTLGVTILQAEDATTGLTLARTHHPDLILMDIHLPGIDGMALTRQLKQEEETKTIRIIALTALALKGDEERIRAAGCDGYIAKPIQYKLFLSTIKEILDSSSN
ncbi:MAG: response regulator [Magnetococcales bacterium]|nr:response regulator [Magnetococcales bacterium]